MFADWMLGPLPALEMLSKSSPVYQSVSPGQLTRRAKAVYVAAWLFEKITTTKISDPSNVNAEVPVQLHYAADWIAASQLSCIAQSNPLRWSQSVLEIMSAALPNLDPARAALLVDQVIESACDLGDDPAIQAWLELYRAVAMRDGESMFAIGRFLLDQSLYADRPHKSYVINATMLGAVSTGHRREAFAVWSEFGMKHFDAGRLPTYIKLVVSLSARFEEPS